MYNLYNINIMNFSIDCPVMEVASSYQLIINWYWSTFICCEDSFMTVFFSSEVVPPDQSLTWMLSSNYWNGVLRRPEETLPSTVLLSSDFLQVTFMSVR